MKKGRLWALAVFTVAIIIAIVLYVKHWNYPPDGIDPCIVPFDATDCHACAGSDKDNRPAGGRVTDGSIKMLCCPSGYEIREYKHVSYCFKKKQQ